MEDKMNNRENNGQTYFYPNLNVCFCTWMLVIRNAMPPTARRERAGKSRLDNADGKKKIKNEEKEHLQV